MPSKLANPHAQADEPQVLRLESSSLSALENDIPKTPRRPGSSSGRSKSQRPTEFRKFLENEELPLTIESSKYLGVTNAGRRVVWTTNLDQLDLSHFLPLCIGGILESLEPYPSFAFDAAMQLLESGVHDTRLLRCLPQIIAQIKGALSTREKDVVHRALLIIQQLVVCDRVGEALADYYRAILPLCNILQDRHLGTGEDLTRHLVGDTLELLEAYGGDDAQFSIQQYVPTFTCQFPSDRFVCT